ncbi:hypothetical protein DJ71_00375 [Halorubrum sp. E3]|nr:hypothetical protein [Halorubrum persicum]OYR98514.1 hypothetical protein DJ71_00375 [Halorubrum sp. E3]
MSTPIKTETQTQSASKRDVGSGDTAVWRVLEAITGALAAVTIFALSLPIFVELVSPFYPLLSTDVFVSMYPMGLLFVLLFMWLFFWAATAISREWASS